MVIWRLKSFKFGSLSTEIFLFRIIEYKLQEYKFLNNWMIIVEITFLRWWNEGVARAPSATPWIRNWHCILYVNVYPLIFTRSLYHSFYWVRRGGFVFKLFILCFFRLLMVRCNSSSVSAKYDSISIYACTYVHTNAVDECM